MRIFNKTVLKINVNRTIPSIKTTVVSINLPNRGRKKIYKNITEHCTLNAFTKKKSKK